MMIMAMMAMVLMASVFSKVNAIFRANLMGFHADVMGFRADLMGVRAHTLGFRADLKPSLAHEGQSRTEAQPRP